uniref:Ras-GEF domain-containing protein n=1 Tax=Syphacia muris TaxID=451379 RepID=A0A0N5AXH3_9BILA
MDRPVVLNSLLCFIHNYRDSLMPNQLKSLINKYFAKTAISCAYALLLELLPPGMSMDPPTDIICLYDRVKKTDQAPVFAAADLSMLPLTLITDESDTKNELLREIRQLKRFIQDALNGKVDESNSTSALTLNEQLSTPKLSSCKLNVSSSSPESASSAGQLNTSTSSTAGAASITSVSSPQNLATSPITNCINTVMNNYHSNTTNTTNSINSNCSNYNSSNFTAVTSASSVAAATATATVNLTTPATTTTTTTTAATAITNLSTKINNVISNSNSSISKSSSNIFNTSNLLTNNNLNCIRNNNVNGLSTVTNHTKRKHESSGTRLDAMVRRLADKQKEKEAREISPPPSAWASQFIEQLNFYNIIRSVATVSQPTIFPASVTKAVLNDTTSW